MIVRFEEITPGDLPRVGGKGLNLGRLSQAGLPVPDGFVVTTEAYVRREEPETLEAILGAYRSLGGTVAVRSSATAEDLAHASFAGQQETVLDVSGEVAVLDAVRHCWASLFTERAVAYRHANGIPDGSAAVAVVIQRMVQPTAAGVLFTCDPSQTDSPHLLIESSWGVGEAVVSGRVTPDRWTVERESGGIVSSNIARKHVMLQAGAVLEVPAARQSLPSLTNTELTALAALGQQVEALYRTPQDIEWAMVDGAPVLLQSRPITACRDERERVRLEEIAYLRERAVPSGTVWARYSLAEVLPEPLPMSWGLWKAFMSGGGGYGRMYRELGYDPDPSLETDGVLDLIAGRPYFNLSRDIRLYFRDYPYDYPLAKLKAAPELAIYPSPETNLSRASKGFLLKLPGVIRQMYAAQKQIERAAEELPVLLERDVFPGLARTAAMLRQTDLTQLSDAELVEVFNEARSAVFEEYASQALKASVLAGLAIQELEGVLKSAIGKQEVSASVDLLLAGAAPPPEQDLIDGIKRLAAGDLSSCEFLDGFGHRGPGEMELANPRWRELGTDALRAPFTSSAAPLTRSDPGSVLAALGRSPAIRKAERPLERARVFTALRESAKHFLMLGYEGLRLVLLELDRRYALHGGIFHLEPAELELLIRGENLSGWIVERRRRRALALGLEAPRVLFSDDLEALGRAVEPAAATDIITGTGVSAGSVEGTALVLRSPDQAPVDARDFILVCPSTDPGWVPLFLRARGVVLETGGVLSHGAIVARELALPAVVNIPDACTRIRTGQRLKVDGSAGKVWLL